MAVNYTGEVMEHKMRVHIKMSVLARELVTRGNTHDNSKLKTPEVDIYSAHIEELSSAKYGTPEYDAVLDKIKPALDHHHKENDHHPQHFENGIVDMNLVQMLEMLCDITIAAEMKGQDILESLPEWMKRNDVPENYYTILRNTIKHIKEI